MIRTNASDSFVNDNMGSGNGEAKLYLRKNFSDEYYRNYFEIDSSKHGKTKTRLDGEVRYRDNGPDDNCYFTKESIEEYIKEQQNNKHLTKSQKQELKNFDLDSLDDKNYFGVNYIFDSQSRSYIGGLDDNFNILRNLSISTQTIVNIEKDRENDEIEFFLTPGKLPK